VHICSWVDMPNTTYLHVIMVAPYINSDHTPANPPYEAMWLQVIPFISVVITRPRLDERFNLNQQRLNLLSSGEMLLLEEIAERKRDAMGRAD
jgi:hypothetical protein